MLTRLEILQEFAKCISDPVYAIETYLKTFDKTYNDGVGAFVPFKLFPKQVEIVRAYEAHRRNIVSKPRQAGVSTTTAAYLAIKAAFADHNSPEKILILANKQLMAQEFLAKVKDFLTQVPRWVWGDEYYGTPEKEKKAIFITNAKGYLTLPNKCEIKAVATSKDALRGFTPTWFVMDEAAFIDEGAEVFSTAQTSLGCITKDSLILTDNGLVTLDELVKEKEKIGFTDLDKPYLVCNKDGKLVGATQTFVSEYGETFKVKTKNGYEIEGSWKHPLLTKINGVDEWVMLRDVKVGDKLILPRGQNIFGNKHVNIETIQENPDDIQIPKNINASIHCDLLYLLGFISGAGKLTAKGLEITSDETVITHLFLTDLFGFKRNMIRDGYDTYIITSQPFISLLKELTIISNDKVVETIPNQLLKCKKSVLSSYIRGFVDARGREEHMKLSINGLDKQLARRFQAIFLNMGILTTTTSHDVTLNDKENEGKKVTRYNVTLTAITSKTYFTDIGTKSDRLKPHSIHELGKTPVESTLIDPEDVEMLLLLMNGEQSLNRFKARVKYFGQRRITHYILNKLLERHGENRLVRKYLDRLVIDKDYLLDEVVSIEKGEDFTYDLHVPETNSFISNGFISHNTGGHAILISTPNGMDALYYKTYDGAKNKLDGKGNGFNIIEMKWYQDKRYNKGLKWWKEDKQTNEKIVVEEKYFTFESYEKMVVEGYKPTSIWYEDMCASMNHDQRMIAQELDVSFLGSGGNVIDDQYVLAQEQRNVRDPKFLAGPGNNIWVWEEPQEGHQYILGADVARGDGADSSTFCILDFTTMEQVAEFCGKLQPDLLGHLVYEYGNLYNAYVVVDTTGGMGIPTVLKLQELGYKNLHCDDVNTKLLENKAYISRVSKESDKTPGFQMGKVRLPLVSHLEHSIREDIVKIRSRRLISEMKTFVYKNGRPDHMDGFHDDCLFALGMALWVLEHSFKKLEKAETQAKAMLDSWVVCTPQMMKMSNNTATNIKQKSPVVVKNNNANDISNFLWLFAKTK